MYPNCSIHVIRLLRSWAGACIAMLEMERNGFCSIGYRIWSSNTVQKGFNIHIGLGYN